MTVEYSPLLILLLLPHCSGYDRSYSGSIHSHRNQLLSGVRRMPAPKYRDIPEMSDLPEMSMPDMSMPDVEKWKNFALVQLRLLSAARILLLKNVLESTHQQQKQRTLAYRKQKHIANVLKEKGSLLSAIF
ncbi:uncharacterized protein LOC142350625 isoform X2 [Convolutriloba macropyga]|uniref:uncharacterized protein LOC142350625 isoform X2 n=1 Tax=Convolutriloba macropyga TaxID=536237 RepID=UPI003F51D939